MVMVSRDDGRADGLAGVEGRVVQVGVLADELPPGHPRRRHRSSPGAGRAGRLGWCRRPRSWCAKASRSWAGVTMPAWCVAVEGVLSRCVPPPPMPTGRRPPSGACRRTESGPGDRPLPPSSRRRDGPPPGRRPLEQPADRPQRRRAGRLDRWLAAAATSQADLPRHLRQRLGEGLHLGRTARGVGGRARWSTRRSRCCRSRAWPCTGRWPSHRGVLLVDLRQQAGSALLQVGLQQVDDLHGAVDVGLEDDEVGVGVALLLAA